MEILTIILAIVVLVFIGLLIFKKEWFISLFGNSITGKVEKKKRIEGEIEVLKKEQKVKVEETTKAYDVRKASELDSITAQINNYKAQIKNLEKAKQDRADMLAEELKVDIDKVVNSYDRKIISKQNQAKKLGYYIDAEQKNIEDVIDPDQPNAPTAETKRPVGFRAEDAIVPTTKPSTKKRGRPRKTTTTKSK